MGAEIDFSFSKPHISRDQIEALIGFRPKDLSLYRKALVHQSVPIYIKHNARNLECTEIQDYMKDSYERLEYLGDAVLYLTVGNLLYKKYPNEKEGFMTRLRAKIIDGPTCTMFGKKINLHNHILYIPPSIMQNIQKPQQHLKPIDGNSKLFTDSIVGDVFEALIGAIHEDLGFGYAESFLLKLIEKHINFDNLTKVDNNYKDILMRYTHCYGYKLPNYKLITPSNPPSEGTQQNGAGGRRIFNVSVTIEKTDGSNIVAEGTGSTKQEAEQDACKNTICPNSNCYCAKIHMKEIENIINRKRQN